MKERQNAYSLLLSIAVMSVMIGFWTDFGSGMEQETMDLDKYRWEERLLFVFARSKEDPEYKAVSKQLSSMKGGIIERDMRIFRVFESDESLSGNSVISQEDAFGLRKKFSVSSGTFTMILVGKDGGVKMKEESLVDLSDVFSLIDAMPMRRIEMKERK